MDMLTNLPKEIQEQILFHLPIKEAGRTSILSSKWRSTWSSIPELKFIDDEIISDRSNSEGVAVKVIDAVFARHNGPIRKFSHFSEEYLMNNEMDGWIENLSKNGIREITLHFPVENMELFPQVPSCFFSCDELNYVNLRSCELKLPSWFKGFKFLHTLVVDDIKISAGDFEKMVSSSPLLNKLIVIGLDGVIKINATNLKHLEVKDSGLEWGKGVNLQVIAQRLENAEFLGFYNSFQVHAPKLSNLCVGIKPDLRYNDIKKKYVRYIGDLPDFKKVHIKYLQFGFQSWMEELLLLNRLKYLCLDLYPRMRLEIPHVDLFEKVIHLQVLDINDSISRLFSSLFYFINLLLQTFVVILQFNYRIHNPPFVTPIWANIDAKEGLFKHLQAVNLFNFRPLGKILSFVKFILGSAPQLLTLTIEEDPKNEGDERMMIKRLLGFPRASTKAQIVLK